MTKRLNPKAVIAVDLFGQAADYEIIKVLHSCTICWCLRMRPSLWAAHTQAKRIARLGALPRPAFLLPTLWAVMGTGGAVFTGDGNLSVALRSLRVHGRGVDKFDNVRIGINRRLNALQAGDPFLHSA